MSDLWLAVVFALVFLGGLVAWRSIMQALLHRELVTYSLRFPADRLKTEDVLRLLTGLSGMLPPWWERLAAQPVLAFEVVATAEGISHRLIVPRSAAALVESGLQAHVPAVRWQLVPDRPVRLTVGAEYRTTTSQRALRTDPAGLSAELLANLQPLAAGETIVVQWLLAASSPVKPPRLASKDEGPVTLDAELLANTDALAARKAKLREPLVVGVGRIAVGASTVGRAGQLLRQVESPWLGGLRSPGVQLLPRLLPRRLVANRVRDRAIPIGRFPCVLNVEEAASALGWPIELTALPGLRLGGCRLLPVAPTVPSQGALLGLSSFPGTTRRGVALEPAARTRHLVCVGPTGTGKSTLLARLIARDMRDGHSVVLLDPKGDLVRTVSVLVPPGRIGDVLVLDASDDERPVGYNPLSSTPKTRELVVEQVLGVMRTIWADFWGPRTDEITRGSLISLATHGEMCLTEIPLLLTDDGFRQRVLSTIEDPAVKNFWTTFEAWSYRERNQAIAPLLNKARSVTMRPRLAGVFGQTTGVDLAEVIANRKILLVNLAAGSIGTEPAYLLGALIFAGLWNAVSARAGVPEEKRPPVMAYLDEFQHLVALPTPADEVLAESRGYGMALHLVTQHLGAIDTDLQRATLANARSKVLFQTSRQDANTFAKELGSGLTPEDLMGIEAFEAVALVYAGGAVQPACTIRTLPLPKPQHNADVVMRQARQRWGVPRAQVEAAMAARQQAVVKRARTAVGTRRRTTK